ncbi:MAG: helix-turn-helix domain-containing protein [Treponema sp.]|nr:helix-turn-helix domain-containing protein [Treponema sp.]
MKKTFADRLAFLISSLGIKQIDFVRRIEYAQSYVSMVLSGAKTSPGPRFINAVCREFNVNPEWLTDGKEPVFTVPGLPLPSEKALVMTKFQLLSDENQQVIEKIMDSLLLKAMTDDKTGNKQGSRQRKK